VLLGATGTAQAASTLLAPPAGATIMTVRPTTQWSVAPRETLKGLEFSSSSAADAVTGDFTTTKDFTDYTAVVQTTGTLHTNTAAEQLHAGTWFWHVLSTDPVLGDLWSPINSFRIPAVVGVVKLTAVPKRNGVEGRLKIAANVVTIGLRVRVIIGHKQCMSKTFSDDLARSEINSTLVYTYLCHPGHRLAKGTRIKVIATVNGSDAHKTKVMVVRV